MLKEPPQGAEVNGYHGCHPVGCQHCDDCGDAFLRGQAHYGVIRQRSRRRQESLLSVTRVLRVLLQDEELEDNHACREEPPRSNEQCAHPENQTNPGLSLLVKIRRPHPGYTATQNGCNNDERYQERCEHRSSVPMNITRWPPPAHGVFLECEYDTSRRAERMPGGV